MRKFLFIRLIIGIFFVSLCIFNGGCRVDYSEQRVQKIIDGDTIEIPGGQYVRYIGIDCPETKRRTASGWIPVNEPFALQARDLNRELVSGRTLRFEFDSEKKDKYGRLLVYCFAGQGSGQVMVQEELLRRGLAYLYIIPPNVKYLERLSGAQNEARANGVGVWSGDLAIDAMDSSGYVGQRKIVRGRIERTVRKANILKLVMNGMDVIIFEKDLMWFEKEGIEASVFYNNRIIEVFGLIKEYHGRPEIIVSHPFLIKID